MSQLVDFVSFCELSNWSVAHLIQNHFNYNKKYPLVKIGSFLNRNKTQVCVDDDTEYKRVTIKLYNGGVFLRDKEIGKHIGTKKQFLIKKGQFLLSKIDARNGAFGLATEEVDGAIVTADFLAFDLDTTKINPYFLVYLTTTKKFMQFAQSASSGTTGRQRIDENRFLDTKIPLPTLEDQQRIVNNYQTKILQAEEQEKEAKNLECRIDAYLINALDIQDYENIIKSTVLLQFSLFSQLNLWSIKDQPSSQKLKSNSYPIVSLNRMPQLAIDVFRGKSPEYDAQGSSIILNQKCNRWDAIEIEHAKKVNDLWFSSINKAFFTQKGDILINSTGEGTIGRATTINDDYSGLLYDSHILLLRFDQEKVNAKYFTYFINSKFGQDQITNLKSATATKQTELGINNLKQIQFPLPPIEVQNLIASNIEVDKNITAVLSDGIQSNRVNAITEFEKEVFQ